MQVSACIAIMPELDSRTAKTRDRLLKAAIEVFAAEGVVGATTREIARVAGVNEVTLFRHFQSKEQLLNAVAQEISHSTTSHLQSGDWTNDLTTDLLTFARHYDQLLETNEAVIRMFIGEAQRHPNEALQVLQQAFQPLRELLVTYLENGIVQGFVRDDLALDVAIDAFTGMLIAGMLRRQMPLMPRSYSRDRYVTQCVDIFVRSIHPITK